ncbi:MAG: hypothetical protein GY861_17725 [bacterium]|nr:hypothetical protein [bacterium]
MGNLEELLPKGLWMYIFNWIGFCTLLKAELVCKDFKKWIHTANGPGIKFQSVTFKLSMSQEILAAIMRLGPKMDKDRLKKMISFHHLLRTCGLLKELHMRYSGWWVAGGSHIVLAFVDQVICAPRGPFLTISWQGEGMRDDNLMELLAFYSNIVTEIEVTVQENTVSVYNALHHCMALKML